MTREDPGVPENLNAAAAAHAPTDKRRGVIYTIAPSPLRAQRIWIGTDDGLIHLTNDDGKTWQNVTPPGLTSWSKVAMLEASHFEVNEAYAAVERHQLQDYEPHIYRTRDSGKTGPRSRMDCPKESTCKRSRRIRNGAACCLPELSERVLSHSMMATIGNRCN
jgi:hypothetical protein